MRSQASFEYMVIVAIVLLVTIPLVGYFYIYTVSSVQISQAQESVRKIANAVEYVASGGPGTATSVGVEIPSYVSSVYVGNHTIMFTLDVPTGHTEVYETVDPNITGIFNYLPGGRSIVKVTNLGKFVQIGEPFIFNPDEIRVIVSKGSSTVVVDNITNELDSAVSLNYSIQGENSDWANSHDFPASLNAGETKQFHINFSVPSDAESGEYYMSLIANSNNMNGELPIILRVVGALHNVIIKFYEDSNYAIETNKFMPGQTVYFKIINLDEDGEQVPVSGNYTLKDQNGVTKSQNDYSTDVYLGSYILNNNWNEVHGIWRLDAQSNSISNSSTFEVKAGLNLNLHLNCSSFTGSIYWWNTNWSNREKIELTGTSQTDFQVKLDIHHLGGMKSDYSDIRFVYFNGTNTKIPYFIESSNSTDAIVWIRVPKIPGTVYMYYNNSNANSESDPYSVFNFYDDFSSFNSSTWEVQPGTQYSYNSGVLKIRRGAFAIAHPLNIDFRNGYLLEARVEYNRYSESEYSGDLQVCSSKFVSPGNANSDSVVLYMVDNPAYNKNVVSFVGSGSTNDYDIDSGEELFPSYRNTWYNVSILINSSSITFYTNGVNLRSYAVNWAKPIHYLSIGSYYGDGYDNIKDTSYDWIRVRKAGTQPHVIFENVDKLNENTTCYISSWWNKNWADRTWVLLKNNRNVTLTNFPVRISLNSSNIDFSKTNGNDIRVVFHGKELPYWIATWNSSTKTAVIYTKVPRLGAYQSDKVWIYYDNPNANSKSDLFSVFYSDNMENGTGKWIYTGLWHLTTRRYNSPNHSFWYGQESTGTYDTGSRNYGYLETKNWVQLYDDPILFYWQFRQTEESYGYDIAYVQISTDNSTWTTIDDTYNDDSGSIKAIDLSQYANKKVLIRFYFDTVDSLYNDYEGWYIDDVLFYTFANITVIPETGLKHTFVPSKFTFNLIPLNQYDNPIDGHVYYSVSLNGSTVESGTEYTSNLTKTITLNSSSVGTWRIFGNWTDILLPNSTTFLVKVE